MIRIGQKIDDFEFDVYQNDKIKKVRFSNYEGKWLVLLFYPVDFASIQPAELEETATYYDQFRKGGAEILTVSMNTAFVRKAWHDDSPSIAKIACPLITDPATELCRYFRTQKEDLRLPERGTIIIDPNGVLKARAFTTRTSAGRIAGTGSGRQILGRIRECLIKGDNHEG
jgi:NADH-dependent peroxiredoxin subunit C